MEILIYQLVIAAIVIGAALLKGAIGLKWAAIGAVVWTVLHIFAPWLMLIQFFTIGVAYAVGSAIVADDK